MKSHSLTFLCVKILPPLEKGVPDFFPIVDFCFVILEVFPECLQLEILLLQLDLGLTSNELDLLDYHHPFYFCFDIFLFSIFLFLWMLIFRLPPFISFSFSNGPEPENIFC